MMKYCCNNFHALKITFANETARLCDALGVDAFEVMDLVCQDTQLNISTAYLKPGFAFGGSCLPKDLRATTYLAKIHDVEVPMLGGIMQSNRHHLDLALRKLLALGKRKIGFIGLSFKTGTDDLRESPLVTLAEQLIGKGMQLPSTIPRSIWPASGGEPQLHREASAAYRADDALGDRGGHCRIRGAGDWSLGAGGRRQAGQPVPPGTGAARSRQATRPGGDSGAG
jgi:hypothetical protein